MKSIAEDIPLFMQLEQLQQAIKEGNEELLDQDREPPLFVLPSGRLGNVSFQDTGSNTVIWDYNPFSYEALNACIRRWAQPMRMQGKGQSAQLVPASEFKSTLVRAYADTGHFPGVPAITRAAEAPIVRPDLTICWDKGYDPLSKTYVTRAMQPSGVVLTNSEAIEAAVEYLLSWFEPFALEYKESLADCMALALTPLLMSYTRARGDAPIPGGLFTADQPGSGKTLLAKLISTMGTGTPVSETTWTEKNEMRKQITTYLLSAEQVVLLDNIKVSMDSEDLESLLTSRWKVDRKFNHQSKIRMANDTMWLFTRNSPDMSKDMLRRLVIVPLSLEKFDGTWDASIVAKAAAERRQIMTAMVALIEHWAANGTPAGSVSIPGYEVWSETVSGILECAGIYGFNQNRPDIINTAITTEDDDMATMVERVARVMGVGKPWKTRDLWDAVNDLTTLGSMTDTDKAAIRKWLDSDAGRAPMMAAGRKIGAVARRKFPHCDFWIERLVSPPNHYKVHYVGAEETVDGVPLSMARQQF